MSGAPDRRWVGITFGLLSAAVETEPDARRRTDQLARLGDVYREHEKSPGRAIEYYRQALELNALHEAARSGLRALLGSEAHAQDAVETLANALLAADEWPGVLELVELRVRASAGPGMRSSLEGRRRVPPERRVTKTSETAASKLGEANWRTRVPGVMPMARACSWTRLGTPR